MQNKQKIVQQLPRQVAPVPTVGLEIEIEQKTLIFWFCSSPGTLPFSCSIRDISCGQSWHDIALHIIALVLYCNHRTTSFLERVVTRFLMLICAICTLVSWYQQRYVSHPLLEYPPSKAAVGNSTIEISNVGSWCTHSISYRSPGQRNNHTRYPCP